MRKKYLFLFVFVLLILFKINNSASAVNKGSIALGISAGNETGPILKYKLNERNALDFGIGFKKDMAIYGDYLWYLWDIFPKVKNGLLGGHVGAGLKAEERKGSDRLYLRTTAGMDYVFEKYPVELFLDAATLFRISPDTGSEIDILIGIRFYLK